MPRGQRVEPGVQIDAADTHGRTARHAGLQKAVAHVGPDDLAGMPVRASTSGTPSRGRSSVDADGFLKSVMVMAMRRGNGGAPSSSMAEYLGRRQGVLRVRAEAFRCHDRVGGVMEAWY